MCVFVCMYMFVKVYVYVYLCMYVCVCVCIFYRSSSLEKYHIAPVTKGQKITIPGFDTTTM